MTAEIYFAQSEEIYFAIDTQKRRLNFPQV